MAADIFTKFFILEEKWQLACDNIGHCTPQRLWCKPGEQPTYPNLTAPKKKKVTNEDSEQKTLTIHQKTTGKEAKSKTEEGKTKVKPKAKKKPKAKNKPKATRYRPTAATPDANT